MKREICYTIFTFLLATCGWGCYTTKQVEVKPCGLLKEEVIVHTKSGGRICLTQYHVTEDSLFGRDKMENFYKAAVNNIAFIEKKEKTRVGKIWHISVLCLFATGTVALIAYFFSVKGLEGMN